MPKTRLYLKTLAPGDFVPRHSCRGFALGRIGDLHLLDPYFFGPSFLDPPLHDAPAYTFQRNLAMRYWHIDDTANPPPCLGGFIINILHCRAGRSTLPIWGVYTGPLSHLSRNVLDFRVIYVASFENQTLNGGLGQHCRTYRKYSRWMGEMFHFELWPRIQPLIWREFAWQAARCRGC